LKYFRESLSAAQNTGIESAVLIVRRALSARDAWRDA
jgi:hypothetical protein